jgi:predicted AAA+ superfamily ATPase
MHSTAPCRASPQSRRIAVPITPVNPNGDELYHILRKRLFAQVAPEAESKRWQSAYREALREAVQMGLTTTSPETLFTRVMDAYPFHPTCASSSASSKRTKASSKPVA